MKIQTKTSAASGARGCATAVLPRPFLLVTLFLFLGNLSIAATPNSSSSSLLGPPMAASTLGFTAPPAAASFPPQPTPIGFNASNPSQASSSSLLSPQPTSQATQNSTQQTSISWEEYIIRLLCEANQSRFMWGRFAGFCGQPVGAQPPVSNIPALNLVGTVPFEKTEYADIGIESLLISRREGLRAAWSVICGLNRLSKFRGHYNLNCGPPWG
ncbi:hypothetical protein MMC07_003802 [Pseudocyphellaria aurata]|nr:hypothetical protein [Pseudocyphellaria aurata]